MPPFTVLESLPETTQAWTDEYSQQVMMTTTDTSHSDMTTSDDFESTLDETSDASSSLTFSDSYNPEKKRHAATQIRIKKKHAKEKCPAMTAFSTNHKIFMISTRQITAYNAMEHDEGTDTTTSKKKGVASRKRREKMK